jgi:hypothetical protein
VCIKGTFGVSSSRIRRCECFVECYAIFIEGRIVYFRPKGGTFTLPSYYTDSPQQALQYIFNTSGYNFVKTPEGRASTSLTTGKGIIWADGYRLSICTHFSQYLTYSSSFCRDAAFASQKNHESCIFVWCTSRFSSRLSIYCTKGTLYISPMLSDLTCFNLW